MLIKNLKVSNGITGETIRDISFETNGQLTGLKLIVDNDENQKSNNAGKSTTIKSIDFCLGASPTILFRGAGNSHEDSTIEDFLYSNQIKFELIVQDLVDNIYTIERSFEIKISKSSKKEVKATVWKLNGNIIKNDSLKGHAELKPIFFGDSEPKPSYRQLMGKFVRDDSFSLNDPINFYHNTTKSSDRRMILDRLFYHNNGTLLQEKSLRTELENLNAQIRVYVKQHKSIGELEEFIKSQEEEIGRLETIIGKHKPSNHSEQYIEHRESFIKLMDEIAYLKSEINSISQSIARYKNDVANIDSRAVQSLFNEMNLYNQTLSKNFEETIEFHQSMLDSRITYLQEILTDRQGKLKRKENEKDKLLPQLDSSFSELRDDLENAISSKVRTEENNKHNKNSLEDWKNCENKKSELEAELSKISNSRENSRIDIFNKYFKQFAQDIYNETIYLSVPEEYIPYTLKNVTNTGTGREKALITIFDMAYIAYINEINQKAPLFTAIDIFEPTDEPTIKKIFDIANSLSGQLIVPVLRSKIQFIENINQYFVLELSQNNKFFKLP